MIDYLRKKLYLLDLISSKSDSDWAAEEEEVLLCLTEKKRKLRSNFYLSKKKTHGQFKITSEFPDNVFPYYFRLNRKQFAEVLGVIQNSIESDGCNAQEPIKPEEKLAVFLR